MPKLIELIEPTNPNAYYAGKYQYAGCPRVPHDPTADTGIALAGIAEQRGQVVSIENNSTIISRERR